MNRIAVARELVSIAKELMSMEFPTQDAYDKYMKEHPDADKSLHTVVEKKEEPAKKDESKKPQTRDYKKVFDDHFKKHTGKTSEEATALWERLDDRGGFIHESVSSGFLKSDVESMIADADDLVKEKKCTKEEVEGLLNLGLAAATGMAAISREDEGDWRKEQEVKRWMSNAREWRQVLKTWKEHISSDKKEET